MGLAEQDIFVRVSLTFWVCGTWHYLSLFGSIFMFHNDKTLLRKDLQDGAYRVSAYFVAKNLTRMPLLWVWPTLYMPVVLLATGLAPSFGAGVAMYGCVILLTSVFESYAMLISAGVGQTDLMPVSILSVTFFFGYAGFLSPANTMPDWVVWTQWVNPLTWFLQLLI